MTTTAPTTCTVVTSATGGRCAAPAVHSFAATTGETFAECEAHDTRRVVAATPGVAVGVGSTVHVRHAGRTKAGTVVRVGRTRVAVEVLTPHGRTSRTVVSVPVAEVAVR